MGGKFGIEKAKFCEIRQAHLHNILVKETPGICVFIVVMMWDMH